MKKREAAIVTAYTDVLIGSFDEAHKYIEEIMQRAVLLHELANNKIIDEIKKRAKDDFCLIVIEDDNGKKTNKEETGEENQKETGTKTKAGNC